MDRDVAQRSTLDFVAITLGIVASLRPAAAELTPARPPQLLSSYRNGVLLIESLAISAAMFWGAMTFLKHQPWFEGGTGTNVDVSSQLACMQF